MPMHTDEFGNPYMTMDEFVKSAMEVSSRHREQSLSSDNVTKPRTNNNRLQPGSFTALGNQFLVFKPDCDKKVHERPQKELHQRLSVLILGVQMLRECQR